MEQSSKSISDVRLRACLVEAEKILLADVLARIPNSHTWVEQYVDSGQADDKITAAIQYAYRQGWKDAREN